MARLPSWRDQLQQSYVGARKWGTGVNSVHSQYTGYEGRNIAPGNYEPANAELVAEHYGFTQEDLDAVEVTTDIQWMGAHPNLDDPSIRGKQDQMPSWGYGKTPGPQGAGKRSIRQAMNPRESTVNQIQSGSGAAGWINKLFGSVLDSTTSDESQLYVQTSMVQRDKVQTNERAVMRGTDDPRHEIPSRITGMKIKVYSGDYRHDDMQPKEQAFGYRAWRYRTAGMDPRTRELIQSNEMYVSEPIRRDLPTDVNVGIAEIETGNDVADYDYTQDWY
jgi:hypothetical protein